MAILKTNVRVSRLERKLSPGGRDNISSDDDELQHRSSESESNDSGNQNDGDDSGAGSDDLYLSELGEIGAEFCQVGNQKCAIPLELYDLPDLSEILSVDVWNNFLTEEERFSLSEFLPDMDQQTFMCTLRELFSASNFYFGSPLLKLFNMLKGGLFEPRNALYHQGLNFLQKREHYHFLWKYQNTMVSTLIQTRDAWENCTGYSIEERLRLLNITRSQRSLMYEKVDDLGLETDSPGREESGDGFWNKKLKDMLVGSKMDRRAAYSVGTYSDVSSRGRAVNLEPAIYGKRNPKGILKVPPTKDVLGCTSPIQYKFGKKSRPYGSNLALHRQDQTVGYDMETAHQTRGPKRGKDDVEKPAYELNLQRDRNAARHSTMGKVGLMKWGKKHKFLKSEDDFATDNHKGFLLSLKNDNSYAHGRNRSMNQMADLEMMTSKQVGNRTFYDYSRDGGKKAKYLDRLQQSSVENQMNTAKDRGHRMLLKGIHIDWSEGSHAFRQNKTQETFPMDQPVKFNDWNVRSKKGKMGQEFRTGKNHVSRSSKGKSSSTFPPQTSNSFFSSNYRAKTSQKEIRTKFEKNGGWGMEEFRGASMFTQSEETESDSSEQIGEEEDINPLRSKMDYPSVGLEGCQSVSVKSVPVPKKVNQLERKGKKEYAQALDRGLCSFKQKGMIRDPDYLRNYATKNFQEDNFSFSAKLADDDWKHTLKSVKNSHMQGEPGEKMHLQLSKAYSAERKWKGKDDHDYSIPQSNSMHDYIGDDDDDLHASARLVDDLAATNRLGKKVQNTEAQLIDRHERANMLLSGCNMVTKKRKGNLTHKDRLGEADYLLSSPSHQQIADLSSLKKRGIKTVDSETGSLDTVPSELIVPQSRVADAGPEAKPVKKPFTLITPTVHTGFSFSIIHLLSAVRMAMITPFTEDVSEVSKHLEKPKREEKNKIHEAVNGAPPSCYHENAGVNISEQMGQNNLPSLTVQEIVNRVRSNPGDPGILETQEPLQDLVRGVLKIFSSKTAPSGAKGWKTLVFYEKAAKSWSWIGPVSSSSSDLDTVEEETSSEAWGLPHKMLVKLVDSFANWLISGQETLRQIGSLPAPPVTLMQPILDEKERFRDLRAQRSLTTISSSSEEVRAYFRREEVLRYSVPDRAFSYTAADGRKSIVAPLRRGGGKSTSKARDHFMLKPDRPPHVTILCLVRDAAARLPGSIGTRADVCILIRDSQYIVEDVTDAQVNQVVSGALDRLHYERDPCVQFDGDRKLWVYLHREREEEDFEDDGTASTKKWKRQRKDALEQSDPDTVSVAYHGTGEHIATGLAAGYDLSSDLNVEPSSLPAEERTELVYNNLALNMKGNSEPFFGLAQGSIHHGHPMDWELLDLNPQREKKMLCQENSAYDDLDGETFDRERPVKLVSASLL